MRIVELPESWRWRALVLRDVELSGEWFTAAELEEVNALRLGKRRDEWMRARIAAKQLAIERGLAIDPRAIRITRPQFSLTHSEPYAGAALESGIDVQVARAIPENAARFFLNDEEAEQLRRCNIAHRLIHFWCAKEAAWKKSGGAITTLRQVPLSLVGADRSTLTFDHVETIAIDDVVIALTTGTPASSPADAQASSPARSGGETPPVQPPRRRRS